MALSAWLPLSPKMTGERNDTGDFNLSSQFRLGSCSVRGRRPHSSPWSMHIYLVLCLAPYWIVALLTHLYTIGAIITHCPINLESTLLGVLLHKHSLPELIFFFFEKDFQTQVVLEKFFFCKKRQKESQYLSTYYTSTTAKLKKMSIIISNNHHHHHLREIKMSLNAACCI